MNAVRLINRYNRSIVAESWTDGAAGPAEPPGPAGHNYASEIARLSAQVDQLVKEPQTQLTRVGQIQAQLDRFAIGRPSSAEPRNRRSTGRIEH